MSALLYSSDEMITATELSRKSKAVFDRFRQRTIDKAVVLHDGKPEFLMMRFDRYEALMQEMAELKKVRQLLTGHSTEEMAQSIAAAEAEIELGATAPFDTAALRNALWPK